MAETYVRALMIRGLKDPTGTDTDAPVLFTDGRITAASLPATVPTSPATTQILPWIPATPEAMAGTVLSADIREPVRAGTPIDVYLTDVDEQLTAVFAEDPAYASTSFWQVGTESGGVWTSGKVAVGSTALMAIGPTAVTSGTYYIGNEAISAVAGSSGNYYSTFTATRGVCGSRARAWRVSPSQYLDDGSDETVEMTSRPNFAQGFEASVYLFAVSGGAVESVVWMRHGYVMRRPEATGDGRWRVTIGDLTDKVAGHTFCGGGGGEVRLSQCVQVYDQSTPPASVSSAVGAVGIGAGHIAAAFGVSLGGGSGEPPVQANIAYLWLTRYEAERLFNEPLHEPGDGHTIISADVSALSSRINNMSAWGSWQLLVKAGGYEWLYRVETLAVATGDTEVFAVTITAPKFVKVRLRLIASTPGASINDSPVEFPVTAIYESRSGFNAGWSTLGGDPIRSGEEAPTVKSRLQLFGTPIATALRLLHSDDGSAATDASYDKIPGGWGAGLPTAYINHGSTAASGIAADEATSALLELNQLLDVQCEYVFEPGGSLGEWLSNICRLHTLLFGGLPSTGKLTLRLWSYALPTGSLTTLAPLAGEENLVSPSERLEPLRVLLLEYGYDPLTLKPRLPPQVIRAKGATPEDYRRAQRIRVWLPGDVAGSAGYIGAIVTRLTFAFFQTLQGEPVKYKVPTFLPDQAFVFGALVNWTDDSIPTPTGYGISSKRHVVVGVEVELATGRQILHLLPDAINDLETSESKIAPTLKVVGIISLTTTLAWLQVESLGDPDFDITLSYGLFWDNLAGSEAKTRVLNFTAHNPTGERRGWLDASAKVLGTAYDNGVSAIALELDPAWARGDFTWADILVANESFVCLTDRRRASTNVQAIDIEPDTVQLYNDGNGNDFFKFAPNSGTPFDGHYSLIDA
jgi:hypothetical protein